MTESQGYLTNHTPGPWRVCRKDVPIGYLPIYARTGVAKLSRIAKTDPHEVGFGISEKEHIANAHLIAAAPDLYEALSKMIAAQSSEDFADAERLGHTAIKKARGEA